MTRVDSLWFFTTSDFTLSTMSVTSSSTPGIVVNSCCALRTLIWVTALPSRLESSTRRRLLPIVVPKPRSNGSAVNLPYVPESDVASTLTMLGSSKPRHRICIAILRRYRNCAVREHHGGRSLQRLYTRLRLGGRQPLCGIGVT